MNSTFIALMLFAGITACAPADAKQSKKSRQRATARSKALRSCVVSLPSQEELRQKFIDAGDKNLSWFNKFARLCGTKVSLLDLVTATQAATHAAAEELVGKILQCNNSVWSSPGELRITKEVVANQREDYAKCNAALWRVLVQDHADAHEMLRKYGYIPTKS